MTGPVHPSAPRSRLRCAVYTRVSTEHGLDMAFNSLDAQREACAAYILSQKHEGWTLLPDHFSDGGYSGGSLDRPDLARLLEAVRARRIDIIVVYKVDRLTRSLADFAKLVELFDAHGVSFVSVTQAFNTTNSMGRLTLNVLLSFAQFEREVTGERIRDKIAASKKKGIRMGGPVPLGYALRDKRLIIDGTEAASVRRIFALYLETGALGPLLLALDAGNIVTKRIFRKDGTSRGGVRFGKGALCYLLRNRAYRGEIGHKGAWYASDHPPIIDGETFEAVQSRLNAAGEGGRQRRRNAGDAFPLAGRIFDDRGNRMTPTFARKNGVHYRYYVSTALHQGRRVEAGTIGRVSAEEIEAAVLCAIAAPDRECSGSPHAQRPNEAERLSEERNSQDRLPTHPAATAALLKGLASAPAAPAAEAGSATHLPAALIAAGRSGATDAFAESINASEGAIPSATSDAALARIIRVTVHHGHLAVEIRVGDATQSLKIPWSPTLQRRAKGILPSPDLAPDAPATTDPKAIETITRRLADIARARRWVDDLTHGRAGSIVALAQRENLSERLIRMKLDLAFTTPTMIREMIAPTKSPGKEGT